jgi:beta-1,2-mannobiose phosphorylase / 1,2-beta-oligomannan phosphorylase
MTSSLKMPIALSREGIVVQPGPDERATFNPAAALDEAGNIHLIFRANPKAGRYVSVLGHSLSRDGGKTFERQANPVITYDGALSSRQVLQLKSWQANSVEDPRLSLINGKWYATLVLLKLPPFSAGQQAITVVAEVSHDFGSFNILGILTPKVFWDKGDCRNSVLFPGLVNGQFWLLHRPQELLPAGRGSLVRYVEFGSQTPAPSSCWISASASLLDMPAGQVLMRVQDQSWEKQGIHAGPPPVPTAHGWIVLYTVKDAGGKYRVGAALVGLKNPLKVLARLPYYLLEPIEPYEVHGDACNNVVFPGGAVVMGDKLRVYYGAGDKLCAQATCSISLLLDELLRHRI